MGLPVALLDTTTLSDIMKGRDPNVRQRARQYLATHGCFEISILTRYEILRGLKAKRATQQIILFDRQCEKSQVLPLTDATIVKAADIYAHLHQQGQLIGDADILIAATALVHDLVLVTENPAHFSRVPNLIIESWRGT